MNDKIHIYILYTCVKRAYNARQTVEYVKGGRLNRTFMFIIIKIIFLPSLVSQRQIVEDDISTQFDLRDFKPSQIIYFNVSLIWYKFVVMNNLMLVVVQFDNVLEQGWVEVNQGTRNLVQTHVSSNKEISGFSKRTLRIFGICQGNCVLCIISS